jgi:hypothetical protein
MDKNEQKKELELDPNLIESMNVLKGKSPGQIGRRQNGVIDIITKKNKPLKSATRKSNRIKHLTLKDGLTAGRLFFTTLSKTISLCSKF